MIKDSTWKFRDFNSHLHINRYLVSAAHRIQIFNLKWTSELIWKFTSIILNFPKPKLLIFTNCNVSMAVVSKIILTLIWILNIKCKFLLSTKAL